MDLRDRNNWTPLHTAIKNSGTQQGCHDAAMELLISTGIRAYLNHFLTLSKARKIFFSNPYILLWDTHRLSWKLIL